MAQPNIIEHIKKQNDAGRLALAIYLVHGYPTVETSEEAFKVLGKYDPIFECSLPESVFHIWCSSPKVKEVQQVVAQNNLSDKDALAFYTDHRPNMLIYTEGTSQQETQKLLTRLEGSIDSVITTNPKLASVLKESLEPSQDEATRPLNVQHVSALSETLERDLTVYEGDMLIYLSLSEVMGGDLLPLEQLQAAVDKIAQTAPHAKILVGFGIRSAEDVAYVRSLKGIHCVTIGTAAITHLDEGMSSFEGWLSKIDQELVYTPA